MEYTLGIDMGASSVKLAVLSAGDQVRFLRRLPHYGSPAKTLAAMLGEMENRFPFSDCAAFAVTGSTAGVLREYLADVPEFAAIPAITEGTRILAPEAGSVIAVGAQTAVFVTKTEGGWRQAPRFSVNESCASGTGSFFEDQMERLGMRIEDYSELTRKAGSIPRLSGRCAVFAKTDIIHRQQEGVPVEDILLGLCYAMVKSYRSTIVRGLPVKKPVLLAGGVALNRGVAQAVRAVFGLKDGELLGETDACPAEKEAGGSIKEADTAGQGDCTEETPAGIPLVCVWDWEQKAVCLQAVGAALGARKMGGKNLWELASALRGEGVREALPTLEPLAAPPSNSQMDASAAQAEIIARWEAAQNAARKLDCDSAVPEGNGNQGRVGAQLEKSSAQNANGSEEEIHVSNSGTGIQPDEMGRTSCTLGVDVGSTSTNLVLLDDTGRLIDYQYLRTRGDPKAVVREGMASIEERLGKYIQIRRIGVTGSGRYLIGKMLGAQTIRDEITAQAKGAVMADPLADTVFEIGGQDSKYISIRNGQVADFQMNKICAAGTGSFIEEQAARLGIKIEEYGDLALTSRAPLDLGERCTVFVETAIHSALAKGAQKNDIAAGLCLSVIRNYLHKVVGTKPVGRHIVLQGGVAYNPATVAAFRQFYGDRLTVSPWFPVSGAIGVAFLAQEEEAREKAAAAAGAGVSQDAAAAAGIGAPRGVVAATAGIEASQNATPASGSGTQQNAGASAAGSGVFQDAPAGSKQGKVDRIPTWEAEREAALRRNMNFYTETKKLYLENYTPPTVESGEIGPDGRLCCEKKTVGIPRCLMLHKLFPMANGFFSELGFRVVLSQESSEETVRLSQQTCRSECCYPVKLVHGHMEQLARMGVDYIFMPAMHTIRHVCSKVEHNYACPFMQTAPMMAAETLRLKERGIELISPVLDMDFGQEMLADAMLGIGRRFGFDERETALAMMTGAFALNEFTEKTETMGEEIVKDLRPGEKAIVLITRQYGIEDPALNMDISMELLKRGYKVINLSHLHAHNLDISDEYPGMYWPFGQHILSGARIVRSTPGLYAIYLTNHGCGPDTMLAHLFREEMQGKPYLQIEVDEHYSKVGVITRLEAFLNSLEQGGDGGFEEGWLERLVAVQSTPGNGAAAMMEETEEPINAAWLEKAKAEANVITGCIGDCEACGMHHETEKPKKENLFGKWEGKKTVRQDQPLRKNVLTALPGYGMHCTLVGDYLTKNGYPAIVMPPERASLEEGRKETTSKEYYTFSMLLGMCLRTAREYRIGKGSVFAGKMWKNAELPQTPEKQQQEGRTQEDGLQFLLPANEGADADGQYWRVIRAILDEKGQEDATVSPVLFDTMLYRYPEELLEGVFHQILAGDLYYMTPIGIRGEFWECTRREQRIRGQKEDLAEEGLCASADFGWLDLVEIAKRIRAAWEQSRAAAQPLEEPWTNGPKGTLLVTGEWPLVYQDTMTGGLWTELEKQGYCLKRMPFSEYLWFLLNDRENGAARGRGKENPEDHAYRQQRLTCFLVQMRELHEILGEASAFSGDLDALVQLASEELGSFTSANGRYRYGKKAQMAGQVDGIINAASMYENTDMILRDHDDGLKAPVLNLAFDGVQDEGVRQKLQSFLYYL